MNLPENYLVICETQKETNEVLSNLKKYENFSNNYWSHWEYITFNKEEEHTYSELDSAKEWFENKNISDYKTFTFKEWKEMKESKTPPQYWYIKITEETLDAVNKVRAKQKKFNGSLKLNDYEYFGINGVSNESVMHGFGKDFIHDETLELTLEEFKSYFLKEDTFILPKKWVVLRTQENYKIINEYFSKNYKWNYTADCYYIGNNQSNDTYMSSTSKIPEGYIEISFEQFQEHILKQKMYSIKELETNKELVVYIDSEEDFFKIKRLTNKFDNFNNFEGNHCYGLYHKSYDSASTKTCIGQYAKYGDVKIITTNQITELQNLKNKMKLIVSITEVLEIHKIASSTWKTKIANYLRRVDSNQNISFNQSEVDEMFKAATSDQKPVLTKIFGEPVKPIEWDKIKTGSKVMLQEANDQRIGGNNNVDYNKPFDVVFWKTSHSIDCKNEFKKAACYETVSTFHQNEKYIRFDATVHTNYITEVIEY